MGVYDNNNSSARFLLALKASNDDRDPNLYPIGMRAYRAFNSEANNLEEEHRLQNDFYKRAARAGKMLEIAYIGRGEEYLDCDKRLTRNQMQQRPRLRGAVIKRATDARTNWAAASAEDKPELLERMRKADAAEISHYHNFTRVTVPKDLEVFLICYCLNRAQLMKQRGGPKYMGVFSSPHFKLEDAQAEEFVHSGFKPLNLVDDENLGVYGMHAADKTVWDATKQRYVERAQHKKNRGLCLIQLYNVQDRLPFSEHISVMCTNVGIGAGVCR